MLTTAYTHAGGIVVRFDGHSPEYLLVSSSANRDLWVFPKGHIELGESPQVAALREVREEAGVRAKVLKNLSESRFSKGEEKVSVLYFLMEYGGPVDADEDREVKWCGYEEARKILSFGDTRKLLKIAHDSLV